jgi:hypothetical protein
MPIEKEYLDAWLTVDEPKPCPYVFKLIEVNERLSPDEHIKVFLGKEMLSSYRNLDYLKFRYGKRPQEQLTKYLLDNAFPSQENQIDKNVGQGDFGEILAGLIVTYYADLEVPLKKMRWKFNRSRSTFCTDIMAHNKGSTISDVYYYEVKTRLRIKKEKVNGVSNHITINAHNALLKDQEAPNEAIADFLSRFYFEIDEFDKADQYGDLVIARHNYTRNFGLFFIINKTSLIKRILQELHDLPPALKPLTVTVVLIQDLAKIIDYTRNTAVAEAIKYVYD